MAQRHIAGVSVGGGGYWTEILDQHRAAYYNPFSVLAPSNRPPAGDDSSGSSSDVEDPQLELPARGGGAPPFTHVAPRPLELPGAHPARGGGAPPVAHVAPHRPLELLAARPARGGGAPPFARTAVPPPLVRAPDAVPAAGSTWTRAASASNSGSALAAADRLVTASADGVAPLSRGRSTTRSRRSDPAWPAPTCCEPTARSSATTASSGRSWRCRRT
ncbi:transcriptional regulatory protein AlgP-like [Panicum virgatum]|uniref:Uncharacterized protein n=1 Tax=Panicum virgatum TaxID=38727 RepID=A0A8T0UDF6_PANVG|nr:transcriptional regulatory protein AlgP-like [Panicum virgatum]KAG2622051.1 hypothetical protein PVAP13_3NG326150 [Panicum virgatum]